MTQATIYALLDSRQPHLIRYVGQTRIALDGRLRRHWVTAMAGAREHRAVWMRFVRFTGGDVVIALLERVAYDQADTSEQAHIARCRGLGYDLTNRTDGGRGRRGWDISDATRRKMSESAKRRGPHSPETYRRAGDFLKASPAHQDHMARMHQNNRGTQRTPEQRERISQSLRGERNGQNVVTWESAARIRERYKAGAVQAHLACEFKCSPATICEIVHNRRWVPA